MSLKNLNQMNFNDAYKLPTVFKMVIYAIVVMVILVLGHIFYFSTQLNELSASEEQEEQLKEDYKMLAVQAVALPFLEKELEQIQESFGVLLKQLPSEVDIPNVLQELHQAATANEVTMESLTPQSRKVDGPIETVPYRIVVQGSYEQLAKFVSDVGQLSRIVTLTDVALAPKADKNNPNFFSLQAVANTYRALDDDSGIEKDK